MKINPKLIFYVAAVILGIFFFLFVVTSTTIGNSVNQQCEITQAKYEGDCVESMIKYLDDESNSYKDRNTTVWALGQMGDERALETLNKYYTGVIPEKEPLDKGISQYELKKAIKLCEGGFNASALIWRSKL